MQDSSPLSGCCPASSPRLAPAAAPPRAGSGWHRRRDTVRRPDANEALVQSGNGDTGEGGTNALSCPDPKATPARADIRHCEPGCAARGSPRLCLPPRQAMSPFLPQLCPLPGSVSSASSLQRQGWQVPGSGCTPGFSTPLPLQPQPGPRHVRPGTEHDAATASVQLPPPTPRPREGSERHAAACTAAAADGNPSSSTSPPLTLGFPSWLGGLCPHLPVPN